MSRPEVPFTPSLDVADVLNALLDRLERRAPVEAAMTTGARSPRAVRVSLDELTLPGYASQVDPEPRRLANEQLQWLEQAGAVRLAWQPGEKGHLLEAVSLVSASSDLVYAAIKRVPATSLRARIEQQLLGERFRFDAQTWQAAALRHVLKQIKENKSPAPFLLADPGFNEDLLTCLAALETLREETPFRVFSVRTFNDSKRFEDLKRAILRLAHFARNDWKRLSENDLLRELNLVANPTYLLLSGAWHAVDALGQSISCGEFLPSLGFPAVQAAHVQRVRVDAPRVICVENLTTFHVMAAAQAPQDASALLCLAGNPAPACRHFLRCLCADLPETIPLYVWADLDYGGFNILAQLRREVSPRFVPYRMDEATLDAYARQARPLTQSDRRNLERQARRPEMQDVQGTLRYLLKRDIKLEQEAIAIDRPLIS